MITLDVQPQGERFTFFSEADPGAPALEFELVAAPGSSGPDPHIHAKQVETFRVVSGEMRARLGKEERVIRGGEPIRIDLGEGSPFLTELQAHGYLLGRAGTPIFRTTIHRGAANGAGVERWDVVPNVEG